MPAAEGTKLSAPPALNNDGSGASATLARMHHLSINYAAAEIKPTVPRGEVLGRKVAILEWQGFIAAPHVVTEHEGGAAASRGAEVGASKVGLSLGF